MSGCCSPQLARKFTERAAATYKTAIHDALVSLPPPRDKIVVAVYKFRDQTGQYKTSATATTFSTAVTQGATSLLIKALEDSGWFTVIEREALPNLLNERQIIRATRAQYAAEGGQQLGAIPPLLYAGVLLEGGIIGYDTNLVTGGAGLALLGYSGSGQVRCDQMTVYLRLVSTQNGQILKSLSITKSILSREIDFGIYRFVRTDALLEAETGFSSNEPPTMCALEAIEKGVYDLIVDGILDNLWTVRNPEDLNAPAIQARLKERREAGSLAVADQGRQAVKPAQSQNAAPAPAAAVNEMPAPQPSASPQPQEATAPQPQEAASPQPQHATPPRTEQSAAPQVQAAAPPPASAATGTGTAEAETPPPPPAPQPEPAPSAEPNRPVLGQEGPGGPPASDATEAPASPLNDTERPAVATESGPGARTELPPEANRPAPSGPLQLSPPPAQEQVQLAIAAKSDRSDPLPPATDASEEHQAQESPGQGMSGLPPTPKTQVRSRGFLNMAFLCDHLSLAEIVVCGFTSLGLAAILAVVARRRRARAQVSYLIT